MSTVFNVYRITNLINYKLYFGYTSKSIQRRWVEHKSSSAAGSKYLIHRAIRKWGESCFSISLESSWPTEEQAKAEEVRLISYWQTNIYRYPDGMGYNMTDGGEGTFGIVRSVECRKKISETKRKIPYKHTDDAKRRIGEASKRRVRSQETGNAISAAKKGKPGRKPTQDEKDASSKRMLGFKHSEESKLLMSKNQKGKVVSTETRKKISDALKGSKLSPETIKKIVLKNIGRKRTPEQKARLSEAKKKYWIKRRELDQKS